MSNYTKNTNFTAKDSLPSGNAGKLILGADFDSEFDELETVSATKEDTSNKGANSGYCGLDSGGLVDESDLPAATTSAKGAVEIATQAEARQGATSKNIDAPALHEIFFSGSMTPITPTTIFSGSPGTSDWSVNWTGTGVLVVTHGQGTSSYQAYAQVRSNNAPTSEPWTTVVSAKTSTAVTFQFYDDTGTLSDPDNADVLLFFTG